MKKELKELYEKKGKIVKEMEDTLSEVKKRTDKLATKEEREKFEKWDTELVEVDEQIAFQKRAAKLDAAKEAEDGVKLEAGDTKVEKKFNDNATASERREALDKAKKVGYSGLSDEERVIVDTDNRDVKVFENFLRYGHNISKEDRDILKKYMPEKRVGSGQSTSATEGGYTIPEGFAGRIVEYMLFNSQLLNWASILRTDTGNTIPFPINDDTANTGELIGEAADLSAATADLVFSVYNLGAYKFSSKVIKVSSEIMQDNGVNLLDYLAKKLAERVARITNTYYTTGTGSSQPQGYLASSAAERGKVTASTSTFTLAEMVAFQDSIDPAYRNGNKIAWAMHSNLLSEIKQLSIASATDGGVWTPSFRDGEPDRILGKPYFLNNAMSSTSATGDKIMAYGDWSKFNVRIVNNFTLKRFDELFAMNDQVGFVGLQRSDSFLENTKAVKYMDIS